MSARDDHADLARFSDGFLKNPCPPEDHCTECRAAAQAHAALAELDRYRAVVVAAVALVDAQDGTTGEYGLAGENLRRHVLALSASSPSLPTQEQP